MENEGKSFACQTCNYIASQDNNLKNHIELLPNKEKCFQCTQCNFVSSENEVLENHIDDVHYDDPDYEEIRYKNTESMLSRVIIKDGKIWNPYHNEWVVCNKGSPLSTLGTHSCLYSVTYSN